MAHHSCAGARLILYAILACCTCSAIAQSEMVTASSFAKPLIVVPPAFPPNSAAPAPGIRVDVIGTVLASGELKAESITSDGSEQKYVDAVAYALRWWRFVPAVDHDQCIPKDEPARLSIWFEGSDKEPRIFFSFPSRADDPAQETLALESIHSPQIDYPDRLGAVEGEVQVLHRVSPDGEVKSVKLLSSTPPGAFDAVVLQSASRTYVTWKEPKPTKDVCANRSFRFCMRGGPASLPFEGCRKRK